MSSSKNHRCSDLCTNRPFLKDKENKFVKEMISPKSSTKGPGSKGQSPEDTTSKRKQGQETEELPRSRKNKGLGRSLVGARIKVWRPDDEMFYKAVVESFDSGSKRHKVTYADGDVEVLRLRDEKWDFISEEKGTSVASETPRGRKRKDDPAKEENTEAPKSDAVDPPIKRGCPKGWRPKSDAVDPPIKRGCPKGWRPNSDAVYPPIKRGRPPKGWQPKSDAVYPPIKRGCPPKGLRPNNGTPSNNSSATPSTKGKTASIDVPKIGSNLNNKVEKTSEDKATGSTEKTKDEMPKDGDDKSASKPKEASIKGKDSKDEGKSTEGKARPGRKPKNAGSDLKNEEKGTYVASETTLRRHKDKSPPSLHPLDLICEAIGRDTQDVGARAQHFASVGEDQNNMNSLQSSKSNKNSLQKMVDFGGQGLECELEQELHDEPLNASANNADQQAQRSDEHVTKRPLTTHDEPLNALANDADQQAQRSDEHVTKRPLTHDEPLNASANDADQQAQRSDEHVTKRPLTTSNGEILKKHKATAEMPCIQETGPVHQESRSAQANLNKQEATQGKDYSISRCLDVLEAMDDVPDGMKILASDVFRDATNREMFLCYAPRLRGPWLKKELEKLHGSHRVN